MGRAEANAQYRAEIRALVERLLAAGWTQSMIATYRNVTKSCVSSWARGASTGTHADRDDLRVALGAPLAASVGLRLGAARVRLEEALVSRQAALAEAIHEEKAPSPALRAKLAAWGLKADSEVRERCAVAVRARWSEVRSTKRALLAATQAQAAFKALVGKAVRS